jgi:hypothetical protein
MNEAIDIHTRIIFAAWLRASKYINSLISLGKPSRVEFIMLDKYRVSVCM